MHGWSSVEMPDQYAYFCVYPDSTAGQVAPGLLLEQKPWIVPIPGTTKLERLIENLGAVHVTFTSEELAEIESAFSGVRIVGERYGESSSILIDR